MDTFHKICEVIKHNPSTLDNYNNALTCCKRILAVDPIYGFKCTKELKEYAIRAIKDDATINDVKKKLFDLIHKILIVETPYSLDSYFQALEYRRPLKEQFYLPRRNKLLKLVRYLEELLISNELDELFLSMPPRTGKTTLILFAYTWQMGMYPESSNLYGSFSGVTAGNFYDGIKEIISDEFTYCWKEIFPNVDFEEKKMCNAKETFLDVGRVKRYHSITCRSIDGSLNGSCDCNGLLTGDDLISGIEEALNPARLASVWTKTHNDFLTRAKEHAKKLWIGTRWSIADPIGVRQKMLLEQDKIRYKIVVVPALDENERSNFEYMYGVGFSTDYYKSKKAEFESIGDVASWSAQYQGEPIERSGLLFPNEDMQYFDDLPDGIATEIVAPVDVAWGGGDACSCPCLYVYKNMKMRNVYDVYVPAVVYEYGDKTISQPKIVNMIREHGITRMQFEKNNRGEDYKNDVAKMVAECGLVCNFSCKSASTAVSKEAKIFANAPDIKLHFHFLSPKKRDKDYKLFMESLLSYTINGKNKHDDAVDSLAQGNEMIKSVQAVSFEIFRRPF